MVARRPTRSDNRPTKNNSRATRHDVGKTAKPDTDSSSDQKARG
jgi:hypothetical protein